MNKWRDQWRESSPSLIPCRTRREKWKMIELNNLKFIVKERMNVELSPNISQSKEMSEALVGTKELQLLQTYIYIYTHTHTHPHKSSV